MHRFIFGMAVALMALALAATSPTVPVEAATAGRTQPSSSLAVFINGPSTLDHLQYCNFELTAYGGTAPYTITWYSQNMNGWPNGDGWVWYGGLSNINNHNTYLRVVVTDALNNSQDAWIYPYYQSGGGC